MSTEMTLYHADRAQNLEQGQRLSLSKSYGDWPSQLVEIVDEYYSEGISIHGNRYLIKFDRAEVDNYIAEWIFELVRQKEFPDKPSRFQAIFGTESLEAAREFGNEFHSDEITIWKLSCQNIHRGDMGLLQVHNLLDCIRNARFYWKGETFLEDPFWEVIGKLPVSVVERVEKYSPDSH